MSDTANVTFVGGHAIEQNLPAESNVDPDTAAEAREAVRKAIQEAGESSAEDAKSSKAKDPYKPAGTVRDSEPDRGPDGKFLPKAETKPEPEKEEPIDLEKANVKQLLKNRERLAELKKSAKDEISQAREAFQKEQAQWQAQQRQFQLEQQRFRQEQEAWKSLKQDPARAIREAGYDPEQFILDLAKEGTPEGQQSRKERELQAALKELQDWKSSQAKQAEEWKYQQQVAQVRQFREHAEKTFTNLAMTEEKYPHVANFYKGRERALIAEGDLTAEEFRSLSGGREASFEDILDYIEDQLAERANTLYSKKGAKQEPAPKVEPAKSKGKQLSPDVSGERRALNQKDLRDLDADERHEAARQAVAVALAASKNSD